MFLRSEGFGEEICYIFCARNMMNCNLFVVDIMSNCVISDVDVFRLSVIYCCSAGNIESCLAVSENRNWCT
jgi:hypothetical protein